MTSAAPLVCSSCEAGHQEPERFCRDCGMPLVHAAGESRHVTERQARARKVKAQYSEGPLVRVASARHQAEAELISGLLLEEGVASVVRRSGGFDVPDFLAAGPRDILVASSGADVARDVLRAPAPDEGAPPAPPREGTPVWVQAFAVAMLAVLIAATAAGVMLAVFG
ncbi:MAG: hypothetical protein AVDCRST_MAG30-720 [uncultured Solirubrobacteraceae bacterium]|uniref:DUF2007 domain-containing protein n=1 Tax=uncultured Solirubrobacteraceae bacterium TaxID=1162706 RepID=A0A6J4RZH3_9ACTN|nr:MAG: hypothetical protein AVDCRST_MAG30-720 [uncultured Solirubrobacteraceae bacterium]